MTFLLPSPTPFLIETKCAIYWMLGSLALSQESSECEFLSKASCISLWMYAYHGSSSTGKVERSVSQQILFGLGEHLWIIALFSSIQNCALLDERKLCVLIFFLHFFFSLFKNESSRYPSRCLRKSLKKEAEGSFIFKSGQEGKEMGHHRLEKSKVSHLGGWIYVTERRRKHS